MLFCHYPISLQLKSSKVMVKEKVVLSIPHFQGMVKENIVFSISQFPTTEVLKSHGNDALASHPNDISRKSYLGPPSFTHPNS